VPELSQEIELKLHTLRQKLSKSPDDPVLYNQLGLAMGAAGRIKDALEAFDQAIAICATYAEALFNRGLALELLGRKPEAYDAVAASILLTPFFADAEEKLGQLAAALHSNVVPKEKWPVPKRRTFLARTKRFFNRKSGKSYRQEDSLPSDERGLRAYLDRDPVNICGLAQLGRILTQQGRLIEAEHFFRFAMLHDSLNSEATLALAGILEQTRRNQAALELLSIAFESGLRPAALCVQLLRLKRTLCDWRDYNKIHEMTLRLVRNDPSACDPFTALNFFEDPADHLLVAKSYGQVFSDFVRPRYARQFETNKRRINIGYISADFHQHATSTLVAELFELHDRSKFSITGYALWTDDGSDIGRRTRRSFDKLRDLWGVSAEDAAEQIEADRIDVLVDLKGYTQNARPEILARRPAPLQVNYLGYPGTMGVPFIDYAIVDSTVAPPSHQKWFSEQLIQLPGSYQINDRQRAGLRKVARDEYGLPADACVFCNFNGNIKITPEAFQLWMRIMNKVPNSVLWLYSGSPMSIENLREAAKRQGVGPNRLFFATNKPHDEHLSRYAVADLFLDSLPYGSHTTGSDALWMGCPMITCLGEAFPGRVGASLLKATGLERLIATSLEDYERLAVELGNSREKLRALRMHLDVTRGTCTLFDTPRNVKYLEAAYAHMWEAFEQGKAPEGFAVPAHNPDRTN